MITLTTEQAARQLLEVAEGIQHGTDWNNGTHAKIYRPKFPEAITALREALDHSADSGKPIDGQAKKAIFFSKCPKCKYAVSSMDAGAVWWCPSCKTEWPFGYEVPVKPEHDGHWSDCSVHNEPAYPNGPCDCGGYPPKPWRCACGANLYIDSNGAPASKAEPAEQEPVAYFLDVKAGCSSKPLYEQVSDEYKNDSDVFPLYAAPQPVSQEYQDHLVNQSFDWAAMAAKHQFAEGYRIGLAEMREKCAKVCDDKHDYMCSRAAAAIRAIKFEGDTGFRPVSEMIAEQEPVGECEVYIGENGEANFDSFRFTLPKHFPSGSYKLYTHPVRTKDLTDDDKAEIECALNMAFDLLCKPVDSIAEMYCFGMGDYDEVRQQLKNARAIIAADREKNNANNNT